MPFTGLDITLLVIMLISGFLAMVRGLTREVLSIFSWAVAAIIPLYLYFYKQDLWLSMLQYILPYLDKRPYADLLLGGIVFLVVLLVVGLICARISDRVLDSRIGALDRTLGFLFGLARGFALVVIAYYIFSGFVPVENQPKWISQARSLPVLVQTGDAIASLLPENPAEHLPGGSDKDTIATPPDQRSDIEPVRRFAKKTGTY
ncbi:MAG: CvpA family protein [Methyloligellaceae bacterium]|nr:MAG: CvpA family protein [Alphaproteobacteria bacterium]